MSTLTPLDLHTMLDIYVGSEFTLPDSQPRREAVDHFLTQGLVEPDSSRPTGYAATDLGKAFVAMLRKTPYPREAFIDPRTDEIVEWAPKL